MKTIRLISIGVGVGVGVGVGLFVLGFVIVAIQADNDKPCREAYGEESFTIYHKGIGLKCVVMSDGHREGNVKPYPYLK